MTFSSRPGGARVLRPGDATVVGRPTAVASDRPRPMPMPNPSAPTWALEEIGAHGETFGGAFVDEAEPSLSTAPSHASAHAAAHELFAMQLDAARAEAYAQGVAEGRAQAEAEMGDRLVTAARAVDNALDAIQDEERLWVANAEENIVALAVAVARHVIDREISESDALLRALVVRALAEFPVSQPVTIRLHPDDHALLSAAVETSSLGAGRAELFWTADARMQRGGCMVEGRERIIDGRVDTALERLYRRLSGTSA